MMNCKQATRLLSERMERELSPREKFGLRVHLMMCRGCRNFGRQMGTLRDLAKAYAKSDTGHQPPDPVDGSASRGGENEDR
ncbi:zf-HC2 domain-containing protein [Microbulbifer elongatus]|uniref:zf-HC2 domain-containing protein n=1 Tax=Microbulbifer elongatus TaxID=86173 RepID=UPI001E4C66E3|nr:zf-HC2 domain-containing protein [Microbulbifer elongatus]